MRQSNQNVILNNQIVQLNEQLEQFRSRLIATVQLIIIGNAANNLIRLYGLFTRIFFSRSRILILKPKFDFLRTPLIKRNLDSERGEEEDEEEKKFQNRRQLKINL